MPLLDACPGNIANLKPLVSFRVKMIDFGARGNGKNERGDGEGDSRCQLRQQPTPAAGDARQGCEPAGPSPFGANAGAEFKRNVDESGKSYCSENNGMGRRNLDAFEPGALVRLDTDDQCVLREQVQSELSSKFSHKSGTLHADGVPISRSVTRSFWPLFSER